MPQFSAKILSRDVVDDDSILSAPDTDLTGVDPYQYAVPEEYDPSTFPMSLDPIQLGIDARESLKKLKIPKEKIDSKQDPDIPMSPSASNKSSDSSDISAQQQLSEQQLLRNYLTSLSRRRDDESDLRDMTNVALDRGRLAMLAEGLSESASKMGNILGTPTGSTMKGFGKEAADLEMSGVDQARKIMAQGDPTAELARQAQISQMLENIRLGRAKQSQGEQEAAFREKEFAERQRQFDINADLARQKAAADKAKAARPPKPVKLTEGELKSQDYGRRMKLAEANIGSLLSRGYDPTTIGAALRKTDLPIVGRYFQNEQDRQYMAAVREWINAHLRKDTGAVIKPEEMKDSMETYFPQPGDDLNTIQQKKASRVSLQKTLEEQGNPNRTASAPEDRKVYIKALTGDNLVKKFTPEQAEKLLQQKQPNGQPMYQRVK